MPKVKYRHLTEDEEKFIRSYAAGHSREEITNALNKKFQTDVPKWKVEYFLSDNKIATGYTTGHKYSKDEICFLEAYAPSHSLNEIQIAFNDKFKLNIKKGALSQCMLRKNIKPGITTRFKKNQVPKNKRPIGFESIQKSSNGIKYVFIKTELPDKWEMKHLLGCMEHMTSDQKKVEFAQIVKDVVGDDDDEETIQIYNEVQDTLNEVLQNEQEKAEESSTNEPDEPLKVVLTEQIINEVLEKVNLFEDQKEAIKKSCADVIPEDTEVAEIIDEKAIKAAEQTRYLNKLKELLLAAAEVLEKKGETELVREIRDAV